MCRGYMLGDCPNRLVRNGRVKEGASSWSRWEVQDRCPRRHDRSVKVRATWTWREEGCLRPVRGCRNRVARRASLPSRGTTIRDGVRLGNRPDSVARSDTSRARP